MAPEFDYQVLASDLDHVEGVCWDPERHCLWAGGEAGQVYRVELDGTTTVATTIRGGALLGLALDARGALYVCDPGNHQVWRVKDDGTYEPFGDAIDYPNYASFSPDGRLYVSDSGSFNDATGQLFVIDPDGTTANVSPRPMSFSNGLCVDETTLWLVESSAPGVSAMALGGGPLDLVIPMERCVPDGLALDAQGGLLISCYQPNQIWRWTKEDGLRLLFEDWTGEYVLSPTNVAFYGEHLDRLALASLCGHNLVTIRPPHPGAALIYPNLQSEKS
ncbi:MAG TPA: SMP-30/gluconolactonase/LRE family protein [Acidimicrobiales bacterium]|jgi:sugar lactone lactonase YvrE|nr:SMP-30/gluconolactonase/LRE family protein [Acidimicrobiales bacterium]